MLYCVLLINIILMKQFRLLLIFCLFFTFLSCGSDDSCMTADWIGTYVLDTDTENCPGENVSLVETIEITEGTTANTVNFDGIEADVDGCSLSYTDPFFGLSGSADLDGDKISASAFGCSGTFIRQ